MKIIQKSQTPKKPLNALERQRKIERRAKRAYALFACLVLSMAVMIVPAFAADDPLQIVENLSEFIFSLIRAIGLIQFMDRLIRTSNQKVFLILDNLKVHHGKKAAAWLDRHQDKIELFFLPPYAPESNPDEHFNHALKLSIHSGDLPRTKYDIRHKTASFMRTLQLCSDKVSAFFQHKQVNHNQSRQNVKYYFRLRAW